MRTLPATDTPWTLPPASATRAHQLRSGFVVQLWAPHHGERHLPGWYEPAARATGDVERLRFLGRLERGLERALWLYADRSTGEELLVDVGGTVHHAVPDHRRRSGVRFVPVDPDGAEAGAVVLAFRPRSQRAE